MVAQSCEPSFGPTGSAPRRRARCAGSASGPRSGRRLPREPDRPAIGSRRTGTGRRTPPASAARAVENSPDWYVNQYGFEFSRGLAPARRRAAGTAPARGCAGSGRRCTRRAGCTSPERRRTPVNGSGGLVSKPNSVMSSGRFAGTLPGRRRQLVEQRAELADVRHRDRVRVGVAHRRRDVLRVRVVGVARRRHGRPRRSPENSSRRNSFGRIGDFAVLASLPSGAVSPIRMMSLSTRWPDATRPA